METLGSLPKVDRGFNLEISKLVGPRGMDDSNFSQGYHQFFEHVCRMMGINHIVQVNDCETSGDWTESDNNTFDYAVGATGKRVGTNCLKLTTTAATDASQYVQTTLIDESKYLPLSLNGKRQADWRDIDYVGFWKHAASSAHFGTDAELQFAIVNDGTASALQDIDGTSGTEHHWCQVDISSLTRDKVEAIRFYGNNANTSEDCYIDDIIRYKYQFNGGPLYGCALPITSGTTLSENHWCAWSIDGVVASSSAAAVADIGPCLLESSTATGTAARGVWAFFPGRFFFLVQANAATVAGEGLEWAANGLAAGVSDGAEEKGWAKGLEGAGAQYDHIFAQFETGGRFIS